MARRFLRLNVHVFTVFLVVGLPLFAIGAYLAVGSGQAQLRQSYGQQLAQVAEHTAAGLDAYIYRRIIDAAVVARVPDVRAAAAAGNRIPFDAASAARLAPGWMSGSRGAARTMDGPRPNAPQSAAPQAAAPQAAAPQAAAPQANAAARFFSDVAATDPLFREILATDVHGRIVATVAPRNAYYVADQAWWKEARGDGQQGRTTVSDILFDPRSRSYYLEIAAPIPGEAKEMAGVLRIVMDARELVAMVADVQLGVSGNAFLLHEDGSVVFSRWPGTSAQQFFAADLLRERLQGVRETAQPTRLYLAARGEDGTGQMIGLARSQLGLTYPHLSWLVAVSQADSELFAPINSTGRNLLLVLALIAVAILGFTLWDSRRLAASPASMDTDLGLVQHPRVHWIEEEEDEEAEKREERPTPASASSSP